MSAKSTSTLEFGDFQTPDRLASRACGLLVRAGVSPSAIVEPTCGKGAFLHVAESVFPDCDVLLGCDVNPEYVAAARLRSPKAVVHCEDFFTKDWLGALDELAEPILVIGNPPWVTNSAMGAVNGRNLPRKSNFQGFSGLDAITGKSNFDISEWMMRHLLDCLSGRCAVLAMLCKTTVARKVLRHAWSKDLQIETSAVYAIDAHADFGAAVDACLLVCILEPGAGAKESRVFGSLEANDADATFALRNGRLVADLALFAAYGDMCGECSFKWRSGVKHDCAKVMELRPAGMRDTYVNGLGEIARLENTFLYPMLKSSELAGGREPSRYMLVTQKTVGAETTEIAKTPLTWRYLESHARMLDSRSSSIYRGRPRFSVFGVGEYSFAPWKVAISGFYKRLDFRVVGPVGGRPVVLDDTCYFLPCRSQAEAATVARLLNTDEAGGFFRSLVFWDTKRPITAGLLGALIEWEHGYHLLGARRPRPGICSPTPRRECEHGGGRACERLASCMELCNEHRAAGRCVEGQRRLVRRSGRHGYDGPNDGQALVSSADRPARFLLCRKPPSRRPRAGKTPPVVRAALAFPSRRPGRAS